jgi:indolepyruvate decarboxylase
MTLHQFLFDELYAQGVRQIFGIPGDFVLNLYDAIERDGRFRMIQFSHEPAVGFAADGAARITGGLGVCCVTYGVGGLNMLNPVACAWAEESPLVVITGGPGRREKRTGVPVHHEVKAYDSQFKVYQEVVEFGAILDDPHTAAASIRRAIDVALKFKRPVYLEVPRDMVNAEITVPDDLEQVELTVDEAAVQEAAQEIIDRLTAARHPVLIVGVGIHRFRLREQVLKLAERLQVPVASSFLGRGIFPTHHPQFAGTYLGIVSPQPLRAVVEESDCLLMLGELISDMSLGVRAERLNEANLIVCAARDVFIKHHRFQDVPLDLLVPRLLESPNLPSRPRAVPPGGSDVSPEIFEPFGEGDEIKVRHVINIANEFCARHPEMPIVADPGDAMFAAVDIRADDCICPAYYATMGFSIPAAMGVQIASGRRPLVLVGDGAFQMTGTEISRAGQYGCNPIILLFNNHEWGMLQVYFPQAGYNETAGWPFARLAELWGGRGFTVRTPRELREALAAADQETRFTLIEILIRSGDISPLLRGFAQAFKTRVTRAQ